MLSVYHAIFWLHVGDRLSSSLAIQATPVNKRHIQFQLLVFHGKTALLEWAADSSVLDLGIKQPLANQLLRMADNGEQNPWLGFLLPFQLPG